MKAMSPAVEKLHMAVYRVSDSDQKPAPKEVMGKLVGTLREPGGYEYDCWTVDGRQLRNRLDTDFALGGSYSRYRYIPVNEIWIERTVDPLELPALLYHEYVEQHYMRWHGMHYEQAHALATGVEQRFRQAQPAASEFGQFVRAALMFFGGMTDK